MKPKCPWCKAKKRMTLFSEDIYRCSSCKLRLINRPDHKVIRRAVEKISDGVYLVHEYLGPMGKQSSKAGTYDTETGFKYGYEGPTFSTYRSDENLVMQDIGFLNEE